MRVLITGVAGFIGSAFARWLQANVPDVRIVGVDDLSSGYRENVPSGVPFIAGKISGIRLDNWFDYVFHFASYAAEVESHTCRLHTIDRVWRETAALINSVQRAGGCGKFVFTSSIAVYGKLTAPFAEDDEPMPNDPYGIAKLACEHDLRCSGLPYVILRPHNVYGPGQNLWDTQRNVFGKWCRAALDDTPATIYGNGEQQRAFTYVDDLMPLVWRAAQLNGEILNVGSDSPITINEAAEVFSVVAKFRKFAHAPARNEAVISYANGEKCQRLLQQMQYTPMNKGIDEMWKWAKLQGKREFVTQPRKEI